MPKPIPYKFRLVYFLLFLGVFLIGFPILVFYSAGYTFDSTLGLSIRGGVYVFVPVPNTTIFVGNELKGTSGFFQKEILIRGLKPEQYLVLTTNDDFWPWAKLVSVKRGEVEPLFPLLVPKVIKTTEIKNTDSEYTRLTTLFKTPIVPRIISPTVSTTTLIQKKVKIWLDHDKIFAEWLGNNDAAPKYFCVARSCTAPIIVFQSSVPIRSIDFYPLRDDAIILALDNGIYAVEIDNRTYQNFYPIFRGQAPDFRVDDDVVYIKDTSYIASLDLQL